jgi:hypothetical protein
MRIKKSGKYIMGAELTAAEKRAMNIEISKQLAEYTRKYQVEIESIFLREMRQKYGHGAVRLRRDFDDFANDLDDLIKRYELGDEDRLWIVQQQLKAEGFDVEQWHREKYKDD